MEGSTQDPHLRVGPRPISAAILGAIMVLSRRPPVLRCPLVLFLAVAIQILLFTSPTRAETMAHVAVDGLDDIEMLALREALRGDDALGL